MLEEKENKPQQYRPMRSAFEEFPEDQYYGWKPHVEPEHDFVITTRNAYTQEIKTYTARAQYFPERELRESCTIRDYEIVVVSMCTKDGQPV